MTGRRSRWFPSPPQMWLESLQTQLLLEDFNNSVVPFRQGGEAYELSTEGVSRHHVDRSLSLDDHYTTAGRLCSRRSNQTADKTRGLARGHL